MKPKITFLLVAVSMFVELTSCWGQSDIYLNTFEVVWKKLNEAYYDSTFGGLNWKDAHDRYLPKISAAGNDEEFYRLTNRMLWELKVSHNNLVPPGFMALREPLICAEGGPGIDIRIINGIPVITSVKPGSSAKGAGSRPGYTIEAVDGITAGQIIREAESAMRPPYNSSGRTAIITKAILCRIYGTPDTEVSICYSDEKGQKVEKKLLRTKRSGVAVGPNGILYLAVDFEVKRFDNGIGYIRLNTFQPPLTAQISAAIKSLGDVTVLFWTSAGIPEEIEKECPIFSCQKKIVYVSAEQGMGKQRYSLILQKVPLAVIWSFGRSASGSASELFVWESARGREGCRFWRTKSGSCYGV